MRSQPHKIAIAAVISFFVLVPGVALMLNPYYPALVFAGESSVGTWMSGAMLVMAATFSLVLAMQRGPWPWIPVSGFFIMLALDERFMFHEFLSERLHFAYPGSTWLSQTPVIAASVAGILVTMVLWRKFLPLNRTFLFIALLLGGTSVLFDIFEMGVLIEEALKLLAELSLVISLTGEINLPEQK